ncbi:2-aminoadipate transaminase [Methanolinea mesophila]|uniref:aminotransferase-like domain-containing protein n=1 Tax=Methanolinea mesophila TaxID=547055 RepID=UPI001AE550A1|nr:PLP-dependent aminotransferase family protein [Methanolinea mesophila]MBP1927471.1 2-aminoadipate transaminase [Methanolinea mesophila]
MEHSYRFADRMRRAPESFLGTLFAVSRDPEILSFAGGLPGSRFIDTEGIARAAEEVLEHEGQEALQYSTTDGYRPLREYIAERYRKRLGLPATPENIQIVNGSQQCLDLVAKIFVNPGDGIGMESPGYLGAIEAFSLYEPVFHGVPLGEEGPDPERFAAVIRDARPGLFYAIPNSQNPSGATYSTESRRMVAETIEESDTIFYEDDAFGELFFDHRPRPPVSALIPEQSVLSGSFSKTVAPGMRIGWIYGPEPVIGQFNVAKQAADLHSNHLCQMVLSRYLAGHDLDAHIRRVSDAYAGQCSVMCDEIDDLLPPGVSHTRPQGGMFLVARLPPEISASRVFEEGIREKVAVLPGTPFFVDGGGDDLIRLNFSSPTEEEIKEGMRRLARVFRRLGGS